MGKFTKDVTSTFITQVITLILGLFTTIIIARILGPEKRGIYSLAILLPSLLITFSNLGIGTATAFHIGKKKYSLNKIFGNNIIFSVLISALAIFLGLIVISFFGDALFAGIKKEYLFLGLLLIPFQIFITLIVSIFWGLQKITEYNFINLLINFIFSALIGILLLGFHLGIKATIIAQIISFLPAGILLFFWVKKKTDGISLKFDKSYFKDSLKYGGKVYLSDLSSFLHYRIDIFLINIFINPLAVGLYSIATAMAEKFWFISTSVARAFFPKVSSETDENRLKEFTPLVCRNTLFVTFLGIIFVLFISRWIIILLFSEAYLNSIQSFNVLLIGMISISGWNILANDLMGRGRPEINTYLTIGSVILNIILNIFLIPRFGIIGAAWATAISYTILCLCTVIVYSKISGNKIRDVIFIKKTDFKIYKNIIALLK